MTARPSLASVVIPSQYQQMTTQQEQTPIHSSQTPIFSKPPFKSQNTQQFTIPITLPSTSSQYDPQNNWIVNRKRPALGNHRTGHAEKVKKMSNIDDLLREDDRNNNLHCLVSMCYLRRNKISIFCCKNVSSQ